jgi:hypothetical protein
MRLLVLVPLVLAGCAQPGQHASTKPIQQDVARISAPLPPDTDNCGTPYKFKLCGIVWRPTHRLPIYAEQLEDIGGNIPISDMPTVIAKNTSLPEPGAPGDYGGLVRRARALPVLPDPPGQNALTSD